MNTWTFIPMRPLSAALKMSRWAGSVSLSATKKPFRQHGAWLRIRNRIRRCSCEKAVAIKFGAQPKSAIGRAYTDNSRLSLAYRSSMSARHAVMACTYGFAGCFLSLCAIGQGLRENYLLAVLISLPASIAWARCHHDWVVAERFAIPDEHEPQTKRP